MSKPKNLMKRNQFEATVWSHVRPLLPSLAGLFLVAFGSITLAFVGWLTWYDMTTWSKDIALIFFGSRTGEHISLGIGMKVIHYFLIGLALLLPGLVTLLRRRSKCPYHFGYLASLPENAPIPQECLFCTHADCIVTLVRQSPSTKEKEGD